MRRPGVSAHAVCLEPYLFHARTKGEFRLFVLFESEAMAPELVEGALTEILDAARAATEEAA